MVVAVDQAFESTRFPTGDADCRLEENSCKKLVRLVVPALPPKSATRVLKLDCSELSVPDDVDVAVELLDRDCIKLFTSATNPEPPL